MGRIIRTLQNNKRIYQAALYLGLTGYGGLAVIDQIRKEYVVKRAIISERKFLNALSLSQILPGSSIINLIALFSYMYAGLIGGIVGTFVYIFPTFVITTVLSALYFQFSTIEFVRQCIAGLNLFLIPLLVNALVGIGSSAYVRKRGVDYRSIILSLLTLLLNYIMHMGVTYLILLSGVLGIVFYTFTGFFDEAPKEVQAINGAFFKHSFAWTLLFLSIIFFGLFLFLTSPQLWQLFSSFFRIGSLAFGGGVAAIPLIEDQFVHQLNWFTASQFWDGIAISQITPGPIFIISAFFGYKVAGIIGAGIATIGMCIPSVLLIILVGKIHARIKHNRMVRGVIRGFLAGFMGVLMALVIDQSVRSLTTLPRVVVAVLSLVLLRKIKGGFFLSLILCIAYAFIG